MPSDSYYQRISRWMLAIFLATAAAVCVAGYFTYRQMREAAERQVRDQLTSVADLKLSQLQTWSDERFEDARIVNANRPMMNALRAVVQGQAAPQQKQAVVHWMETLCAGSRYASAFLFDRHARLMAHTGGAYSDATQFREMVEQAMGAKLALLRDLHADSRGGKLHLGLNVPLRLKAEGEPFGVFSLGIDPDRTFFPILDRPLGPVSAGETVLVRRAGDEALLLGWLAEKGVARQLLHIPLSRTKVVAVKAILGQRGLVSGVDPMGRPIMAVVRALPESEWLLISRIPLARIEGPIRQRAIPIVIVILLLIGAAGLGVASLWRLQHLRFLEARHKAELEKEVLASHYNYLSRSALDAILLVDEDSRILETNERALEMYGYSRDELLGLHMAALRSQEGRAAFQDQWRRVRSESALLFETQQARKDGSVFPVETNVRPIVVDGKTYYQVIVRDITERNRQRKQLENANRLYAVLSANNLAIAKAATQQEVFDSVCRIGVEEGGFKLVVIGLPDEARTFLRPVACAKVSEYSPSPLPLSAEPGAPGDHPTARAFLTGQVCVVDDMATDPDRAPWQERACSYGLRSAVCTPLSGQGGVVGVLAIFAAEPHFFDAKEVALVEEMAAAISYAVGRLEEERKRKQAEEALRGSEKRYRQLVESLPVGILVHSDLRVVYMSPTGLRMFRASSPDDVVGQPVLNLVHPDYHESVRQRAAQSADAPSPNVEQRYVRLDGTTYDVEVSAVPIEVDGQRARLVFFLDITQRKKAEEERARLEQQFLQAQKMESVGRLAGGVAHDFNNHLTVINGYCEMLLSALPAGDPMRAEVASIRTAGQQAAELVRQLLAFSRKRVIEPKQVNLNHLVLESRRMLERLIGEYIEFETVLDPRLGDVLADPTQILQILMNLAVNARDAMGAGGRLTIETRNLQVDAAQAARNVGARTGDFVRLAVSDTGVGMDAETLRHVFEPFFTTKPQTVGTGLGLSTVYAIVHQSNGWIEVQSAPGAGACFRIFLPRATGTAAPEPEAAPMNVASAGRETALLVEDQPQVRELSATILRGHGYTVLEAASGAEALAVAAAHSGAIEILVSDVLMPGMTGPQLARELLALRPAVKVLYVSGYATGAQLEELMADDNFHHLDKPFTPASLAAKVREVLQA